MQGSDIKIKMMSRFETPIQIKHPEFSPYTDNGGTAAAICGDDYVIVATETRLASGYYVYTRDQPKIFQLTPQTLLACSGCWCDVLSFAKVIQSRIRNYLHEHNRTISTPACAQLVSTMLYYKRFFPYYVSTLVAGFDDQGKGVVYHYDPVGSFEAHRYSVSGSSSALIQPLLDHLVGRKYIDGLTARDDVNLTLDQALSIMKDLFVSAGERDIYVGDEVEIQIVTRSGIQVQRIQLRKD